MSEQNKDRDIVIADFKERSSLQQMLTKDELIAANLEIAADEAVLVTKNTDGTLSISRSSHSAGRSLAVLSTKLLIVVPLGFTGALAVTTAGLEISGAARKRDDPTELDEVDIAFVVEQMKPGWSAVLAAYPTKLVEKATDSFKKLGAVMVWYAPESRIEEVVRQNQIDNI